MTDDSDISDLPDELRQTLDSPLEPGTDVGDYRITALIGEGTFGRVYSAVHRLLERPVAIKVLNRAFSSNATVVRRFLEEARAVNKIRHRNIVDISSFGTLGGERQYCVMELLEGVTLAELLADRGQLELDEALPILRGVARALDAAHDAGIAHRDLKPDNVFVTFDEDEQPFPKLLDFGIAKLMDTKDSSVRTRTGAAMGTPAYMSPEQCHGIDVDPRTDVYAFGIMVHELLTGQPPFDSNTVMGLMLKQMNEPPPTMSSLRPSLPGELDAPVLSMLAKEPDERPATAGEAFDALVSAAVAAGLDLEHQRVGARGSARSLPRRSGSTLASHDEIANAQTLEADSLEEAGATKPAATGGVASSQGTLGTLETDSSARPKGGRTWLVGIATLAIVGVAALVWSRSPPVHDAVTPEVARPEPSPTNAANVPPEPPPATSSAAPVATSITLRIESPAGSAEVWLDERKLGSTSEPLSLPRSDDSVELRVQKPGFRPAKLRITANEDQTQRVVLEPVRPATAPPKPTGPDVPPELASPFPQ